jgi:hypothetical protein
MNTLEVVLWIAGLAAILTVLGFVAWSLWPLRNARLMRCPESGSIAYVEVQEVWLPGETSPTPRVTRCDLWPLRKPCDRGCLRRYHESVPGRRVNVDALRPFEHP